ncbi:MAG: hypothetical protein JNK05_42070 [Myxococcales bacterium]|nr:hypothetical protein [Myxococcales bacterium]
MHIAVSLVACSSPLPSPSRVNGLRVLRVFTDPPELAASDTAAVARVLAVDGAMDRSRATSLRWFYCDGSVLDDASRCARDPALHALAGDGESLRVERSALGASDARTVLVAFCPGRAATFDRARGAIACPDEAGLSYAQTEGVLAFYTVRAARAGAAPNVAPVIERASLDGDNGALWTVRRCASEPCASSELVIEPSSASAERVGDAREALTASFFATDGSFDRPRAVSTEAAPTGPLRARWTPPRTRGSVRVWIVLRDDRGASAAIEKSVTVTE